jgi:hypothetical protein
VLHYASSAKIRAMIAPTHPLAAQKSNLRLGSLQETEVRCLLGIPIIGIGGAIRIGIVSIFDSSAKTVILVVQGVFGAMERFFPFLRACIMERDTGA